MQTALIKMRRAHLETQKDMANLINVDLRTYQNKEAGVSQFKQDEMFIIAKHYNCLIDEIFLPTYFMKREE